MCRRHPAIAVYKQPIRLDTVLVENYTVHSIYKQPIRLDKAAEQLIIKP